MDLAVETVGPDDGNPLLIAHGLFGSGRNWQSVAKRLGRRCVMVDMRNHGDSPWSDDHSYAAMASDLAAVIEARGGGPMNVFGHSMGGKAAMMLALERPDLVGHLLVGDIAPVTYDHSLMRLVKAMQSLDLAGLERRSQADRRFAELVEERAIRGFLLQSLDAQAGRWTLNLDVLEAQMDAIVGWPEIEGRFEGPVTVLRGATSDYVQPVHEDRIRAHFPSAEIVTIPDAGHWFHAENPDATVAALERIG